MEINIKMPDDLAKKLNHFLVEAWCCQKGQPSCFYYDECLKMEHGCLCSIWEKAIIDGLRDAEYGDDDGA